MHFVSLQQMIDDMRTWSAELPTDLIAIAGVPRSGVLPAVQLALHRNIHLATLEDLVRGRTPWASPLRRGVPARSLGRILVVEDSINTGKTLLGVRKQLAQRNDILYGAVYGTSPFPPGVDFVFREVPLPRCFEWNVFHSNQITRAGVDMDGVLCVDWQGHEEDGGPGVLRYQNHLETVRVRHLPTYPVMAVVTSRLEKYRPQTIDWLRQHNVQFGELVMSPHPTAASRRAAQDHAIQKADWYNTHPEAGLFVESHIDQSRMIAERTGRPVLCTDRMQLFPGVVNLARTSREGRHVKQRPPNGSSVREQSVSTGKPSQIANTRLTVYTAIIGDYDTLLPPTVDYSQDGVRYVCITDQAIQCPPWEIVDPKQVQPEIMERIRDPRRIARWFKFHPHRLFPKTSTLWIDGRCKLLGDPRRLMASMQSGVAMFAHPHRRTLWEEFGPAKGRSRCPERIDEQKAHYVQDGCPRDLKLWASGVTAHWDEPDANTLLEGVWRELEQFGDRDQLALPYVAWKTGVTISPLPGNLLRNDWVRVLSHNHEA